MSQSTVRSASWEGACHGHRQLADVLKCSLCLLFLTVYLGVDACACECHCMWRPEALGSLELELPNVVAEN